MEPEEIFQKPKQQGLSIELDEGEDIITQIKQAMDNHKIDKATVAEANGRIKQGTMVYSDKVKETNIPLDNEEIQGATGRFELNQSSNAFEGELALIIKKDDKFISGNVINATAMQGFKIKLRFIKEE